MSNLDLFKGNALVKGDLFKSLMETNKKMAGSVGAGNRISIRGKRFRMVVGGEEVWVRKEPTLNVAIIDSSEIQRTYFKGAYDPKAEKRTPPHCWSVDSKKPAPEVPEKNRMSSACDKCKMNIKGSGQGDSRACRFSQRLAVMLEGDTETVYSLQVPAASIFGAAKGSDMGLQAYVKYLSAHETPVQALMTEIRFDDDAESPKLFFKPVRPLEEDELNALLEARDGEAAKAAVTLTVNLDTDEEIAIEDADDDVPPPVVKASTKRKVVEIDEEEEAPAPKKRKVVEVEDTSDDEEEEAPPPKKRTKAEAPAAGAGDLASLLDEWDD